MARFVVDGESYELVQEEDPRELSSDFSYRSPYGYPATLRITGGDVRVMFLMTVGTYTHRGWWTRTSEVGSDVVCERAVRLARRKGAGFCRLSEDELAEVYNGPPTSLTEELQRATRALPAADGHLVTALLAIGCSAGEPDRHAIDDWIACHANELAVAPLASWLDEPSLGDRDAYSTRSAFEFLRASCARVSVELGLDTTAWDARLEERRPAVGLRAFSRPWGIPPDHWWWRQGRRAEDGSYWYPYDDD